MSFVIGTIYQNRDVYITADTKANSKFRLREYPDVVKTFSIDKYTLIGVAGDYPFAIDVVSNMKKGATTEQELLLNFAFALKSADAKWSAEFKKHFDAMFMLAGHMQDRPYIKVITFHQGKFSLFDKPYSIGDYQYFLANPDDLQYEACLGLCEKILADTSYEAPQKRLERIVRNIAHYSRLVNDKPTTLCCLGNA